MCIYTYISVYVCVYAGGSEGRSGLGLWTLRHSRPGFRKRSARGGDGEEGSEGIRQSEGAESAGEMRRGRGGQVTPSVCGELEERDDFA